MRRMAGVGFGMAAALLLSLLASCTFVVDGDGDGGGFSQTRTFYSDPSMDGYIFLVPPASYGGSSAGASARVGDDSSNRGQRAVLSFDLAVLPDQVQIESATLWVHQGNAGSGDPFATLGSVLVDRVRYGTFSVDATLWGGEAAYAGVLAGWSAPGSWHQLDVTDLARQEIESYRATRLQFRLYHQLTTDGDRVEDTASWDMGEDFANAAELVITYR